MDVSSQLTLLLLALFMVFLNGFFVASEFSIVKVRESRIQVLIQKGKGRARKARSLVQHMDEYLSATQLGITIASLALGWIGEPAFASLFEPLFRNLGGLKPIVTHSLAASSAFLLITLLHIVIGELAPKSLAIQRADRVILWISTPLIWFYKISYPLIWVLNGTANFFLRLVGIAPMSESDLAHSEEELRLILADSHAKGFLDLDERKMLERVLDFTDRSVRQVMVPSVEIIFLDLQKSLEENLEIARRNRHTRYPLCDGTLDRVVGIIHVKDLFWHYRHSAETFNLELGKRPVQFVPESQYIKFLLTEFRDSRTHLAVVVDEYGATVGMVTLEDILEELVGEIQDEFDIEMPPPMIRKTGGEQYMIHGRALLEDVEHKLGITIDDEENDTIGGHIMMVLGRTAQVGDEITVGGQFRIRVVGMKGLQITDLVSEKLTGD
ncbi:hemolysin family protein [Acidobacteria bacterium AH-259-D05]|nr:hemolysin family protein [Acidobacteria bacterium AH-259-D05]